MEQNGGLRSGRDDRRNTDIRESRRMDDGTVAQFVVRRSGKIKNTQAKRGKPACKCLFLTWAGDQ